MSVYGKNHYNIVKYQPPTNKNKWGKKNWIQSSVYGVQGQVTVIGKQLTTMLHQMQRSFSQLVQFPQIRNVWFCLMGRHLAAVNCTEGWVNSSIYSFLIYLPVFRPTSHSYSISYLALLRPKTLPRQRKTPKTQKDQLLLSGITSMLWLPPLCFISLHSSIYFLSSRYLF